MDDDARPTTVHVDVAGRGALVTGAASGTGLACAMRLEAAGARVLMVDRDRPRRDVDVLSPGDVRTPPVWAPQNLVDDGGSNQDLDVECAGSILGSRTAFGVGGTPNGSGAVA
jgi:3-hydroxybutyrate dehydrogenase